jgi:hypothetical protein
MFNDLEIIERLNINQYLFLQDIGFYIVTLPTIWQQAWVTYSMSENSLIFHLYRRISQNVEITYHIPINNTAIIIISE